MLKSPISGIIFIEVFRLSKEKEGDTDQIGQPRQKQSSDAAPKVKDTTYEFRPLKTIQFCQGLYQEQSIKQAQCQLICIRKKRSIGAKPLTETEITVSKFEQLKLDYSAQLLLMCGFRNTNGEKGVLSIDVESGRVDKIALEPQYNGQIEHLQAMTFQLSDSSVAVGLLVGGQVDKNNE